MLQLKRISWIVPATVGLGFLVGTVLAVGHHAFYQSLQGKPVAYQSGNAFQDYVARQETNLAIGTAFTFLVRAALVAALSTAYVQLSRKTLLKTSTQATLSAVDTTFSGLTSIVSIIKIWVWWHYPLLFVVALIGWILPILAIFPPATLTVVSTLRSVKSQTTQAPNIDFTTLNYLNTMSAGAVVDPRSNTTLYYYNGPSRAVRDVVQAVANDGDLMTISPPAANSSWSLDFYGPSLHCSNMSDDMQLAVKTNIVEVMNSTVATEACAAYGFLGWITSDANLAPLPFMLTGNGTYEINTFDTLTPNTTATFYLAAFPNMMTTIADGDHVISEACQYRSWVTSTVTDGFFGNSTIIQCTMQNATYQVDLEYVNGKQSVNISTTLTDSPTLNNITYGAYGPTPAGNGSFSNCTSLSSDSSQCVVDQTLLQMLSYQAILDALCEVVTGHIDVPIDETAPTFSSRITDTILHNTPELAFLSRDILTVLDLGSLQHIMSSINATIVNGIVNTDQPVSNTSLVNTLQSIFKNAVVSMLSSAKLQPNYTSLYAPSPVTLTVNNVENIYSYAAYKLWIAYSLSVALTAIAIILGVHATFRNGGSYSSDFSTDLRIAHQVSLDADIANDE